VEKAQSGHPGMPIGLAPAAYVIWTRHMKYNPADPLWHNRDRFILSGGHGSMLLYSLLYLTGYGLTLTTSSSSGSGRARPRDIPNTTRIWASR